MIVTTYTCDKCGKTQTEPKQMWELGIVAREQTAHFGRWVGTPKESALWCRSCVVKLGLLPSTENDPPKPTPTPTFEDMLREIIREEMEG